MANIVNSVNSNTNLLVNAEFVRLTVEGGPDGGVYTFSSGYKVETFTDTASGLQVTNVNPGNTANTLAFKPLGALVGVSGHQRDLTVTSFDTNISLAGIDPNKLKLVIDASIKGSKIEIWRGFYNANNILTEASKRYTGIVTGYTLTENRVGEIDTFVLDLHCSSYKRVLENRHSGRFTNSQSWRQNGNANDTSMDAVANLTNIVFPFGQKLA
jgi:hypothetical protein